MADLTAAHDSLLYGTKAKRPTTALICCYFYRLSFQNWLKIRNALFSQNWQNKVYYGHFIFDLDGQCRVVDKEKIQVFLVLTDNNGFIFVIVSQKFCCTSGNTEFVQLVLR